MDQSENPYQSPSVEYPAVLPAFPQSDVPWARPYETGHTRAVGVIVCSVITICVHVFFIGNHLFVMWWLREGKRFVRANVLSNEILGPVLISFMFLMFLASFVALLMWIHRAYQNLPSLGFERPRFSPGWSVGYFFMPILNFFRPYQAMRDIWEGSDPNPLASPGDLYSRRVESIFLIGWWLLWLASMFIVRAATVIITGTRTHDQLQVSRLDIEFNIIAIISIIATILLVRTIDCNQTERHEQISLLRAS
jgi:hypothetical protein